MPIYHVKCKKCDKIFDEYSNVEDIDKIRCECGGNTEIWFGGLKAVAIQIWRPYWEENITHQPVLVESKQHLKKLCKDNDCIAHRLD